MLRKLVAMSLCVVALAPLVASADTAGLVDGIWFSQTAVTDATPVTVYAVMRNEASEPLTGIATLTVDGIATRAVEVRVSAHNITRIAVAHQFPVGTYRVGMTFTPTNNTAVTNTVLATEQLTVHPDADGDGVANDADSDDDNDGIADVDDAEPLTPAPQEPAPSLSERGQELLARLTAQRDADEGTEPATDDVSEGGLGGVIGSVEDARKRSAQVVRTYEQEQRAALADIEAQRASSEGFEPTAQEEGERRSHQIAAAGAAVTGTILEHGILFYGHIAVLGASAIHVCWGFIRRRFGDEELEDDDEEE